MKSMLIVKDLELEQMMEKLINWFESDFSRTKDGGFYSWYNPKKPGYVYDEITGYGVKLFAWLYKLTGKNKYKDYAVNSADYIVKKISASGAISRKGVEYVFDTGICLSGILSLGDIGGDLNRCHEPIIKMGNFIADSLSKKIVAFDKGVPVTNSTRWSDNYYVHILKTAIPLYQLYKYSKEEKYLILIKALFRDLSGKIFVKDANLYTHSHCYGLESVCFMKKALEETFYDGLIKQGADWLASHQNQDGSVYNWYFNNEEKPLKVCDTTSQAARLWLLAGENYYIDNIINAFSFLKKNQSGFGGLYYYDGSEDVNNWSSMFCLQAIYWYLNKPESDWIL